MKLFFVTLSMCVFLWEPTLSVNMMLPENLCPTVCDCKWKFGKRAVECIGQNLITVPEPTNPDTQIIDLSGNSLQILPQEAFARTGLINLQKIRLRNCTLGQIHNRAFKQLKNLVEIDLSLNLLIQIPTDAFKDTPFLRELILSENPITKLDADSLNYLGALVKLDLSMCRLREIDAEAFNNLRSLEIVKINDNNISYLPLSSLKRISKLKVIDLNDNPWVCDCRLRELRMWLDKYKLATNAICSVPTRLTGRQLTNLSTDEFACKPEILPVSRYIETLVGKNTTVICKMEAMPSPNIRWYWNGRLLQNGSHFNSHQKIYIFEDGDVRKKSSLILTNSQESDSNEFYCVAENKGGNAEANFTVHVTLETMVFWGSTQMMGLVIGLLIIASIITLCLLFKYSRVRPESVCENKSPNNLECVSGNEIHPTPTDAPRVEALSNVLQPENCQGQNCNPVLKPPRANDVSYTRNHYELGSIATASVPVMLSPTSATIDPDLINDTRPESAARPGSGEYNRELSDSLYPSGFWDQLKANQANHLSRTISSSIPTCYSDKTPIIENCSVDGSHEELRHLTRTFPRSHAPVGAVTAIDAPYPVDYGLPIGGARTLRVWQRAPPVLPPVSGLRRVVTITRPVGDDGFPDGCATDV